MRLTAFSDYALRVLMYAAAAEDSLVTVSETARSSCTYSGPHHA